MNFIFGAVVPYIFGQITHFDQRTKLKDSKGYSFNPNFYSFTYNKRSNVSITKLKSNYAKNVRVSS